MIKLLAVILCLAIVLSGGCSGEDPHSVPGSAEDNLIVVGTAMVGAGIGVARNQYGERKIRFIRR